MSTNQPGTIIKCPACETPIYLHNQHTCPVCEQPVCYYCEEGHAARHEEEDDAEVQE